MPTLHGSCAVQQKPLPQTVLSCAPDLQPGCPLAACGGVPALIADHAAAAAAGNLESGARCCAARTARQGQGCSDAVLRAINSLCQVGALSLCSWVLFTAAQAGRRQAVLKRLSVMKVTRLNLVPLCAYTAELFHAAATRVDSVSPRRPPSRGAVALCFCGLSKLPHLQPLCSRPDARPGALL